MIIDMAAKKAARTARMQAKAERIRGSADEAQPGSEVVTTEATAK
jgi:hypothetical protein